MRSPTDAWQPATYDRFQAERAQPGVFLLGLLRPYTGGRVADLGCGTGVASVALAEQGAREVVAVDASAAMLDQARARERPATVRLVHADVADTDAWAGDEPFDVLFSNACLHWLPSHQQLIPRLLARVRPGGQVAFQMPMNGDHTSHQTARAVATSGPWASRLLALSSTTTNAPGAGPVWPGVATEADYERWLAEAGFDERRVFTHVFQHEVADADAIATWLEGAYLTRVREVLSEPGDRSSPQSSPQSPLWPAYLDAYRQALRRALGDERPMIYTFKRLFVWGMHR